MKQIKDQAQLFFHIDSKFKSWKFVEDKQVEKRELNIFELNEDKNLAQIFDKPEEQWVTQEELIDFCENRKDELKQDDEIWNYGCGNFFLLKSGDEFFVAGVYFGSVGLLVNVYRLSYGLFCYALDKNRFVLPATKPVLIPQSNTAIEDAINLLKKEGYVISKQF